jgi:hypothetical protein
VTTALPPSSRPAAGRAPLAETPPPEKPLPESLLPRAQLPETRQAAGLAALLSLTPAATPKAPAATPKSPVATPNVADGLTPPAAKVPDLAAPIRPQPARRRLAVPLPLVVIVTVQAVLSARFLHANTAFGDEALYLWAGHLDWAHWLHGQSIPAFTTWFSGSPVIYPPIGALADSIGGLAGARILSLCFMVGASCLLWGTTSRLYGRQAAFFATALFAVIGPTLHLGAFATYDAMALFLMALAAWCACGGRTREDATGWILAAAAALALANAAKYASAIFDPVIVVMAVLSAYPRPGGKAALRRGALLVACLIGAMAVLLRLGGSWYLAGIGKTTTKRPDGLASAASVLQDSWQWTAVVLVAALTGVVIAVAQSRSRSWSSVALITTLAAAALLVPAEQARIHTTISLDKHVDFGAWLAAIAAGYALCQLASWLRPRYARALATLGLAAAVIPVAATGVAQAQTMVRWPGAARLVTFLRPQTSHGGRFLAETDDVLEYYLPRTSWRQWSNTVSITRRDGRFENAIGKPGQYAGAISHHYFSLVILSFSETGAVDQAILQDLHANPDYKVIYNKPWDGSVLGHYVVWKYQPAAQHGAA